LEGTKTTLQELGSILEELLEETSQGSSTCISEESHIYPSATLQEGVDGLEEEHQLMEHEEYLGSLMVMEGYQHEMLEDVWMS
jgi:hypothetical protein